MSDKFIRQSLLIGEPATKKLHSSHVAVFGIGGVGSYAAEALARCGIGRLTLFDGDTVAESNINRQLIATTETVGKNKAVLMKDRISHINPESAVNAEQIFYTPENAEQFDLSQFDYIVDAVDMISAKIELAVRAQDTGVPLISCMGAGNKLDPTLFRVADIYNTSVCPLARVMRRELRARNIRSLKVVYSQEPSRKSGDGQPVGSIAFVPSVAGLILAGEVVKTLSGINP